MKNILRNGLLGFFKILINPHVTMWFGLYCITVTLFYIETQSILKGMMFGVISAGLKTVWTMIHKKIYHKPIRCAICSEQL